MFAKNFNDSLDIIDCSRHTNRLDKQHIENWWWWWWYCSNDDDIDDDDCYDNDDNDTAADNDHDES